jgi:hypothetical protein
MAVHTTNIIHAVFLFQSNNTGNDSDKEWEQRDRIMRDMIQIFHNDDQAGDTSPNILDLPPRAVQGRIIVSEQHDNP